MALRRRLRGEGGATLIELALALPVAMLMTSGFIYYCLLLFSMGSACYGGRAALRYACLHSTASYTPTTQAALAGIVNRFVLSYPTNTCTVTYTGGISISQPVAVNVAVTYSLSILGTTFKPISFNWVASGIVIE